MKHAASSRRPIVHRAGRPSDAARCWPLVRRGFCPAGRRHPAAPARKRADVGWSVPRPHPGGSASANPRRPGPVRRTPGMAQSRTRSRRSKSSASASRGESTARSPSPLGCGSSRKPGLARHRGVDGHPRRRLVAPHHRAAVDRTRHWGRPDGFRSSPGHRTLITGLSPLRGGCAEEATIFNASLNCTTTKITPIGDRQRRPCAQPCPPVPGAMMARSFCGASLATACALSVPSRAAH